jgi:xanthine dehydrogenase molybdenum-binding subunit
MTTTADRKASGKQAYRVIGTRPIRHDGYDKVTGRARYAADVPIVGLLHGAMLRSPHAHANIRSIDTSKAEAMPGVHAVIIAKDLPINDGSEIDWGQVMANPRVFAELSMASRKVVFQGQPVAAVAATDPHLAREAADAIEVDYEALPPMLDVLEAMKPDAPLIHDTLTAREIQSRIDRGQDTGAHGNIASHLQFKRGDIEQGFKDADAIVEREFTTKMVHQGYIEPRTTTAHWATDGHVTIWTSTQGHFGIRKSIAELLAVPESTVKVVPMEIGGGFGGKVYINLDAVAAVLSQKTGHPVKIAMSRQEEFEGGGPTSGSYLWGRIGADKNGKITAAHIWMAYEAGGFSGSPMGSGAMTGLSPYDLDNLLVDGYDVVVNKPKTGAYRAPGAPQAALIIEAIVDELAEKLGIDPVDLRLRNVAREGTRAPNGVPFPVIGCAEVEEAMKAHPHYSAPLEGPYHGRGIAVGSWQNGGGFSSATLSVNSDGRVSLVTGSVDIGGSRPALAMQAAEVLGVEAEDMIPSIGDTESVGWTGTTGGSRTTMSTGMAVVAAAEKIVEELKGRAAVLWEVKPEDVAHETGVYVNTKSPGDRFTFKELAAQAMLTGGPVTASGTSNPRHLAQAFCGNIVDVEVDPETGKVAILRYTIIEDVGTAAHPSYVEGQLQGGTAQGIGWALNEEYYWNEGGVMANSSFLDYRMPTSLDLPMLDTVLIEVPNPNQPFGIRGVGEVSLVPPLAAIANAIHNATGIRMSQLPMSPGAILKALAEKNAASSG